MSINAKQARFTSKIAKLIVWANDHGYTLIAAELYRTPEQAALYAKQGKGIKNSQHTKKMALDMFLLVDGKVTWENSAYEPIGEKWKTMDPDARWGGDMRRRDSVHFSFIHNGVF